MNPNSRENFPKESENKKMDSIYEVTKIEEGFWAIGENGVRVYLIEGDNKSLIVDTGYGNGDIKSVAKSLTSKPIILVNTHVDGDHVGCNGSFQKAYVHPLEIKNYPAELKTELIPIEEGYIFDLGNKKFEVLATPGHTPGSIMLLDRDSGKLISGDSLSFAAIFMFGENRDIHQYIKTMEALKAKIKQVSEIWPSHGPCPIDIDALDELVEGAKKLVDGELKGKQPPRELPAKLYEYKRAKFLF